MGLREVHQGKKHQQARIEKGDVVLVEDKKKMGTVENSCRIRNYHWQGWIHSWS